MEKRFFESWVESYLRALREKRLLVVIDSSSHGCIAHFKLVISGGGRPHGLADVGSRTYTRHKLL